MWFQRRSNCDRLWEGVSFLGHQFVHLSCALILCVSYAEAKVITLTEEVPLYQERRGVQFITKLPVGTKVKIDELTVESVSQNSRAHIHTILDQNGRRKKSEAPLVPNIEVMELPEDSGVDISQFSNKNYYLSLKDINRPAALNQARPSTPMPSLPPREDTVPKSEDIVPQKEEIAPQSEPPVLEVDAFQQAFLKAREESKKKDQADNTQASTTINCTDCATSGSSTLFDQVAALAQVSQVASEQIEPTRPAPKPPVPDTMKAAIAGGMSLSPAALSNIVWKQAIRTRQVANFLGGGYRSGNNSKGKCAAAVKDSLVEAGICRSRPNGNAHDLHRLGTLNQNCNVSRLSSRDARNAEVGTVIVYSGYAGRRPHSYGHVETVIAVTPEILASVRRNLSPNIQVGQKLWCSDYCRAAPTQTPNNPVAGIYKIQ